MTTATTFDNDNNASNATVPNTTTILVLFGSQTGNAEQAAQDFCRACTSVHLYDSYCSNIGSSEANTRVIPIVTKCMSLDDFLEMNRCQFHSSTTLILFVSSYGVGGPPLGCYRFRDVCDCIIENQQQSESSDPNENSHFKNDAAKVLVQNLSFQNLLSYAICGLGDSRYTTYMNNPKVIDETLRKYLHATPLCDMAQADASSKSKVQQSDVIAHWIDQLWSPLSMVIYDDPNRTENKEERLQQLQEQLVKLCQAIIPDYHPPAITTTSTTKATTTDTTNTNRRLQNNMIVMTIVMVLIAIIIAQFLLL